MHCKENCNTAVTEPTPSPPFAPCLPTSDPKMLGPSNDIPANCVEHDLWINYTYNHGCYPGSEVDRALDASQTADESMLFMMPDTNLSTPHPAPGKVSPAESISTTGLNGGASGYSTPSTTYFGSPQIGEESFLGLGASMFNQAAETKKPVSDWSGQSKAASCSFLSLGNDRKSMDMCCHGRSGIGNGFSSPGVLSRGFFARWHLLQFRTYRSTSFLHVGQ